MKQLQVAPFNFPTFYKYVSFYLLVQATFIFCIPGAVIAQELPKAENRFVFVFSGTLAAFCFTAPHQTPAAR